MAVLLIIQDILISYLKLGFYQLQVVAIPPLKSLMSSNPDILSILILLIVLYVSFLIFLTTTRAIYNLFISIIRLIIFIFMIGFILWVVTRGISGVKEDIQSLSSSQYMNYYEGINGEGGGFSFGQLLSDNLNMGAGYQAFDFVMNNVASALASQATTQRSGPTATATAYYKQAQATMRGSDYKWY